MLAAVVMLPLASCNNDAPESNYITAIIGFTSTPAEYFGGPDTSYGENLYYGAPNQITKGWMCQVKEDTYLQFPVNYGQTYDESFNPVWGYSFYNGGMAISNWHNMNGDTYMNQLSVFSSSSPSGGPFVVANGYSMTANTENPMMSTLSDYDGCGRIYITDADGYTVANQGMAGTSVSGVAKKGWFYSVAVANTTYAYWTMYNGNDFTQRLQDTNGWFKVQFIAFDSNESNANPVGYVDFYLANFDQTQAGKAGYVGTILDQWYTVYLTTIPQCSILVVNFDGSDKSEWGLNTPAYCALDLITVLFEKDNVL